MKFDYLISTECADGTGGESCCTSGNLCGQGEGGCEFDDECFGDLKCGSDKCDTSLGFPANYSCCYDPTNSTCTSSQFDCKAKGCKNPESKQCKGTCIPKHWANNGKEECADGSDEDITGKCIILCNSRKVQYFNLI